MSISFDERFDRLLTNMDRLAALLSGCGETHWAEWIQRDSEKIGRHQRHGLDSLLSTFGGMGSLNDVLVHPVNGHPIDPNEIDRVNEELGALRSAVYSDASALRRELG